MGNRVIPVGEPADWGADDVDRMSRVSDTDKVDARDYWRRNAPGTMPQAGAGSVNAKDLIDARPRKPKRNRA